MTSRRWRVSAPMLAQCSSSSSSNPVGTFPVMPPPHHRGTTLSRPNSCLPGRRDGATGERGLPVELDAAHLAAGEEGSVGVDPFLFHHVAVAVWEADVEG